MSKIDESRIKQLKTIKEYHTAIIAGINFYIDKVYNLKDAYFNDDNSLKDGLTKDEKLELYINGLDNDIPKYEAIKNKLVNKNFGDLSAYEIQLCALIMMFVRQQFFKQVNDLNKSIKIADNIIKSIMKTINKDNESNS